MNSNSLDTPGSYRSSTGKDYTYTVQVGDWDLDHPSACLFTFTILGSGGTFEKVIAVNPEAVIGVPTSSRLQAARRVAEDKLYRKLDAGNEADEPTPLA